MNIFNKIVGKILYFIARFFDIILGGLIYLLDILEDIVESIFNFAKILLVLGPFTILLFMMTGLFSTIVFLGLFLFLGKELNKFLKFFKFMVTEYFYDRAENRLSGKAIRFSKMSEYGREYIRQKEREEAEARRRREEAEARRRRAQEEEARRRFEEFFGGGWTFGGGGYYGGTGQDRTGNGQYYPGFGSQFKEEYEKNCDILKVPYTAGKEEIRQAYRKRAKEYHPDLNKSEGATEMFQKINDAHEFLNENNIEKYRNMQ